MAHHPSSTASLTSAAFERYTGVGHMRARALARSANGTGLRMLDLCDGNFRDAEARALVMSLHPHNLTELWLVGSMPG
jgi:hypothetical protein